jgi:hypothetical protein
MRTLGLRFAIRSTAFRTAGNRPLSASISIDHPGSRVFSARARSAGEFLTTGVSRFGGQRPGARFFPSLIQ